MNQQPNSKLIGREKTTRAIGYVLLLMMMVCIIMTINTLLHNTVPEWPSDVISGITLFIVLDRLYTYRSFKPLIPLSPDWAKSFGAQWVVIILFIRLLLSYAKGPDAFIADMSLFARGYTPAFFTPEFIVTLLLALLAWYLPGQFLDLLGELGLNQELALREDADPSQSDLLPAHQRLANLTFSTGIALVVLATLTRINLRAVFIFNAQASFASFNHFSGGEVGALLYFVFGLALLSQSRLVSLQTHWNRQHIPVSSSNLTRRWALYSLLFFSLLIVVVGILPSGDSIGFFSLLATLLGFLVNILLLFARLIVFVAALVFIIPLLLFGKPIPLKDRLPPLPSLLPEPPPTPLLPVTHNALWVLVRSVVLWGALIAIIVFSLIWFAKQHGGLLVAIRKTRFANWLMSAWQWLSRNADTARISLSHAIADGWQNIVSRLEGKRIIPRPVLIRLKSLDPRRQIYFFYLAMIRRSGDYGVARKPSQTPSEHSDALKKTLPSAEEDIDAVTDAFMMARYSREKIDSTKVNLIKTAWGSVRRAFTAQSNKK
ncbi:MAG: DUF4129 domain-containing protein [Anaerolineales bacterium]|nr:DUF4129 domain-containing protein [Anaerolineales bacterium]